MAALIFGVGGALFIAFAGPPGAVPVPRAFVKLGFISVPLSLGLHGVDALGMPLSALFTSAPWQAGWSTSFGRSVMFAVISLILAYFSLRSRCRLAFAIALAATTFCATAFAATGHASAAYPQMLTRVMVFAHALVLLFWIGALFPLTRALATGERQPLQRFSDVIPFAVGILLVSGTTLVAVQLGPDPSRWPGPYTWVLMAKLALLLVLFMLAAYNRWFLTDSVMSGNATAGRHLLSVVRVEVGLIIIVLAVASGWRFTVPPRAMVVQTVAGMPVMVHLHSHEAMAMVTVESDTVGPVAADVEVTDAAMAPVEPQSMQLHLSNPTLGIEKVSVNVLRDIDGTWQTDGLVVPAAGTWQLELVIRVSRFKMMTLQGEMVVR